MTEDVGAAEGQDEGDILLAYRNLEATCLLALSPFFFPDQQFVPECKPRATQAPAVRWSCSPVHQDNREAFYSVYLLYIIFPALADPSG